MAAAIKKTYGAEARLIEGADGVFDVKVNGTLIYSKHETGRFPEDREVLELLKSHATPSTRPCR